MNSVRVVAWIAGLRLEPKYRFSVITSSSRFSLAYATPESPSTSAAASSATSASRVPTAPRSLEDMPTSCANYGPRRDAPHRHARGDPADPTDSFKVEEVERPPGEPLRPDFLLREREPGAARVGLAVGGGPGEPGARSLRESAQFQASANFARSSADDREACTRWGGSAGLPRTVRVCCWLPRLACRGRAPEV